MSYNDIAAGKSLPEDINVVIEIPANADPIKYEIDKDSGEVFVDRFFSTPMHYPCNYGYIPNTLCGDGDPADVLVIAPYNLIPGCVIRCRPVGILHMEDDGGEDAKLIAVPVSKLTKIYDNVNDIDDVEPLLRQQIQHFFEHYKDLEEGKWVKIKGWGGVKEAHKEIMDALEREKNS